MRKRIKLYAGLVCPRRSLDYRRLENYFSANGCDIVTDMSTATHAVVVTCGFIERNIQESLKIINYVKNYNAKVIVGGCLSDISPESLYEIKDIELFTTKDINKIDTIFPEFKLKLKDIPDANYHHDYHEIDTICGKRDNYIEECFYDRYNFEYKIKTFTIRVADGCNCKCTYCSHRDAIGPFKSKSLAECVEEFKKGLDQGYSTFQITAMDTGHYGIDLKTSLPELIDTFLQIESNVQLILEDINPAWLVKYSDHINKYCEHKIIKQIQAPIQSGSDEILKRMKRYSETRKLKSVLSTFKKYNPELHLSSEVLVGFPGETEIDFQATLDFLKDSNFNYVYFYPYFENEIVESRKLLPKVSQQEISERLKKTIDFCKTHKISYCVFDVPN